MATQIEETFLQYLRDIQVKMIEDGSSYHSQVEEIQKQFAKFGLTNEQIAMILSDLNSKATQYITQYSNFSALELLKLKIDQPLREAELAIKQAQLKIEQEKAKQEEAKTKLTEAQECLVREQCKESKKKQALLGYQADTEKKQQRLIERQAGLVYRQTIGYNDNLRIKKAEFAGNVAGFAVNADSDSAQSALAHFNSLVGAI